jgi:signal transduction histidine kinase
VQEGVQNINQLATEVLDLGKVESSRDKNFEKVYLNPIIGDVLGAQKPVLDNRKQILKVMLDGNLPAVFGDSVQLRQMIENLIGNAIKYTGEGGRIKVSAHQENDQIIFRVEDNGLGIPAADQAKIFERFFRAKNVSPQSQGTGLGLAITKSIVDNHRGRIWVDSKEEEGSTFSVVLPVYEELNPTPDD